VRKISIDNYWEALDGIESKSEAIVLKQIVGWEDVYKNLMEASLLALNYANGEKCPEKKRLPLAFMKTVLSQFRCLWKLVSTGYSSSGACIAASIFETAKVVRVISVSDKDLEVIFKSKTMDVPWKAKKLCQKVAKIDAQESDPELSNKLENEYWQISYLTYKWLCQFKHPTSQYVVHDLSVAASEQGFHLTPLPNVSEFDLSEKFKILATSASSVWSMCKTVCEEYDVFSEENKNAEKVDGLLVKVHQDILELMGSIDHKKYGSIKVFNRSFVDTDFSESKNKFGK